MTRLIDRRARRTTKQSEKPIGGLLDPRFVYVPSTKSDIRATFARIREQQSKGK